MKPQKQTIKGPLHTDVEPGDPYVDLPVVGVEPVYCAKEPMQAKVTRYYERTPLRWMKPGPDGKLVPR